MLHFLFPSDPLDPKEADDIFREQAEAMRELGFGVSLFSLEELQIGNFKIRGPIPKGATVVYRGWMMEAPEYEKLVEMIGSRGAMPLTSLEAYLSCHHLPNWYPLISDFTAETRMFPTDADLSKELSALGWNKFFLKDYVKSLKTSVGSVVSKPEEVATVLAEMKKFRGAIEGGICVRRFESFRKGSETRYFVIQGVPHASSDAVPNLVAQCARRIRNPFFSVDVAIREDGVERVVEVGDGQVSDLVGWDVNGFSKLWATMG
jgi:hypothetical protein